MSCKFKYNGNEYTREEFARILESDPILRNKMQDKNCSSCLI